MQIWQKMVALTGGGVLLGTLAGFGIDPSMKPPPDPPWRSTFSAHASPYQIVESGPTDLTAPNWYDTPVDIEVPRYAPYVPAFARLDAVPLPDPIPDDGVSSPGDPIEPATITMVGADPTARVVALDAESAAGEARAAEAAAAPVAPSPEGLPAVTDEPATL